MLFRFSSGVFNKRFVPMADFGELQPNCMQMILSPEPFAAVFEVLMRRCPPKFGYHLLCSIALQHDT